jgi:hypothetical protein
VWECDSRRFNEDLVWVRVVGLGDNISGVLGVGAWKRAAVGSGWGWWRKSWSA